MRGFVIGKATVYTDESGVATRIPVIVTLLGVLEPLVDYFLKHSHDRSGMWRAKVCRAVVLFCEYVQANPREHDYRVLFENFVQRLYTGTVDYRSGLDPSELYWAPKAHDDARNITTNLTDFFDYLGEQRPAASRINPKYAGNSFDRKIDRAAYEIKRAQAFLGHIWSPTTENGHWTRPVRRTKLQTGNAPEFPENKFEELLYEGFKVNGVPDYRGMLITLLMHGAGFRVSEPFHLYIGDVLVDPSDEDRAMVLIHHPELGLAPRDWKNAFGKLLEPIQF